MLVYILIIVAGVVLDQVTKAIIVATVSGQATLPIIPNVLHLTYMENTGAAFSLFSNSQLFLIIITIIFIGLIGYLFYLLPKTKPFFLANLGFSLILSGAIGNLIDRVRLSYVVDFIDLRIINFAIFNLADALIVVGAIILIVAYARNRQLLNVDLNPVRHRKFEPEDQSTVEEVKPIHKNVIKDLLIHKNRDTAPEVKTKLIRLPNHNQDNVTEANYTGASYVSSDSILNTDINSPISLERETKIYEERIKIHNQNRYSKQSDHYEQFIKGQLEEERPERGSTERFYDSLDSYEKSVKNQATSVISFAEKEEKPKVWDPGEFKPITQKKRYSFDWNPEVSTKEKQKKSYTAQLDNYEISVEKQKGKSVKPQTENPFEPEEQEVSRARKRYDPSTESYLESIRAASKKTYTNT